MEPLSGTREPPAPPARAIVALPCRFVNIFPLWLNSDDPALLPEMAELQLAAASVTRNADLAVRLVRSEGGRSLVTAVALPGDPPAKLCEPEVAEFVASPDAERLPPDSVVVWEEAGQRVIAVTSGEVPVYWESRAATVPEEIFGDLACLLARLETEGVVARVGRIVLRLPSTPALREELARRFDAEVAVEDRPAPRLPPQDAARLVPVSVLQKRAAARQRRMLIRAAVLFGVAVLGAAALLFGRQQMLAIENARLKKALDAEEARVAAVSAAQARWAALRPALDPDLYPVERLLQASLLMPADGLRLTIFEQSVEDGALRVLIIGEAASPQAAFAFSESVRTHPAWSMFQWQIPQPAILPNNAARFRMEGTFPYASSL